MARVGLRIDVSTLRDTREGMPRLLEILSKYNIRASIFFSIGPDSTGRHLWRLMKPQFLWKMLRSNAASLYGWGILLAGTAWPGKEIGHVNADIVRETAKHHEVGLHARDHHTWQAHSDSWDRQTMIDGTTCGLRTLEEIIGQPVTCSVAAGQRADQKVIKVKEAFHLRYSSDCHEIIPFRPSLESGNSGIAQVLMTLPAQDEVVSQDMRAEDFNDWLLNRILRDKGMPVYTIHAEIEGCAYQHNFVDLLKRAAREGVTFCPLSELLSGTLPPGQVVRGNIAGREGWLSYQQVVGSR